MTTLITEDAKSVRELKIERDKAKEAYDELDKAYQKLQFELIERMKSEECDSLKVDGTLFVPAQTIYGQVQDRSEFIKWAQENDDELIEYKERKALVNARVREAMDNDETLPPGLGFYVKEYLSLRAG